MKNVLRLSKKTYAYVRPYMTLNILSIILNQTSSILVLMLPLALKYLIDDILSIGDWGKLPYFACIIAIIIVGSQITDLGANIIYAKFSETAFSDARNELFSKLIKKKLCFFDKKSDGDLISRIMQDSSNIHVLLSYLLDKFLTNFVKIIVITVVIFKIDIKLAIISMITVPIFFILNKTFTNKLRSSINDTREYQAKLTDFYITNFRNIKLIKNFSSEEFECKKGNELNESSKKIQIKTEILGYFMTSTMGIVTSLNQLLVLIIGGIEISNGVMTIGGLIAFNTYLAYMYTPFVQITSAYSELNRAIIGLERFFEYNGDEYVENLNDGEVCGITEGEIKIEKLNFYYNKDKKILDNANLKVNSGEKILIEGQSGNGKSTLVSLLKRFYSISDNCIFIDGKEINSINIKSLRDNIFYLSQDNMFFDGTIRENFKRINASVTDEEIHEALNKACINDLICSKENDGLDTTMSKNAGTFSGGQKQRLSLARVFVQSSKIIIFDEPFNGIDKLTVEKIWCNLKDIFKDKTVIIIDHNFQHRDYFDRIFNLEDGKIHNF